MAGGTGDRNVPRTRGPECPRYVAQAFQPAGSGDFPVARPTPTFNHTRVLVNGKPVIDNWTWHGPTNNDGVFVQEADGTVPVAVEYFEIDGFATLQMQIEPAVD